MWEQKQVFTVGIRWAARVSGLALTALVAVISIGQGVPDVAAQPTEVVLEFVAFGMMIAGFLLGWRWEGIGGGLALAGFALFCGVELIVNASFPGGAIPWFAVPGILLLISHVISRDPSRSTGSSQPAL